MPAPSITSTNPVFEQISSGVPYSRTITASNSPTSFSASLPAGLSINSSGVISGTPTATSPTATTVSVTATNADGTSAAQTWLIVVLPFVAGLSGNSFQRALDFDANFGTLQIPGVGVPVPTYRNTSPIRKTAAELDFDRTNSAGENVEYLTSWRVNDRFALSVGLVSKGVLQDANVTNVTVTLRGEEGGNRIVVSEADFTETGSGASTRYETTVYLDPDLLNNIVSDAEGTVETLKPMLLGVELAAAEDAREYDSGLKTETISTLDENDTVAKTINIDLVAAGSTPLKYRIDCALVIPSDPGNGVELEREVTVHWNGSAFVVDSVSGTAAGTGTPSVSGTWAATLTNTSITGDSTGFQVAVSTTTSNPSPEYQRYVFELPTGQDLTGTDQISWTGPTLFLYDGDDILIGSSTVGNVLDNGPALLAAIEEAWDDASDAAEVVSVAAKSDTPTTAVITVLSTTDARSIGWDTADPPGSTIGGALVSFPAQPDYTDAYVTCRVRGVAMDDSAKIFNSAAVPILIERNPTRE